MLARGSHMGWGGRRPTESVTVRASIDEIVLWRRHGTSSYSLLWTHIGQYRSYRTGHGSLLTVWMEKNVGRACVNTAGGVCRIA